ncbi:hypothetical protein Daesc_001913 [Daldinia eschscholtzii]|uniref:Deoxyribonuclease NucA/NucB domain-containing protein n=1 Tax=Daldinia eschscholtzii TaxID=292717 RepID=A0AAX6MVV3_9PEZI
MLKLLIFSLFATATLAATDFGVLKFNCAKGAAACNNACYYINCHAKDHGIQDPDKVIYEPDLEQQNVNRINSGCRALTYQDGGRSTVSVCQSFPYSQKFIPSNKQSEVSKWQCDEWPPASSQQEPFDSKKGKRIPNSLRCMTGSENGSLGGQMSSFYTDAGGSKSKFPGRPKDPMKAGDYFRVKFDISNVLDKSTVRYCDDSKGPINCENDGYQFGLSRLGKAAHGKPEGRITAPVDYDEDNRYRLLGGMHGDLLECSLKFSRHGDDEFRSTVLTDAKNHDHKVKDFKITKPNGSHKLTGLPKDLEIKRTGAIGSKIEFEYAPGQKQNPNWFEWDTESKGTGKGPATGSKHNPKDGSSRAYCHIVKKTEKDDKKDDKKDGKKDDKKGKQTGGKKKTKRTGRKGKGSSSHGSSGHGSSSHGSLPIRPAHGGSSGHQSGSHSGSQQPHHGSGSGSGSGSHKGAGSQQGHHGGSSSGNTGGHTGAGAGGSTSGSGNTANDKKVEVIECYFPCYEHANGR